MIRFIYNLFWPIGLLFFLPGYLVKMVRRGGYREKFGQRLGIYGAEVRAHLSKQTSTWLHAVSVGEVSIALKLAYALRALEPDLHCVLTTTTTTGFALANKTAPPWIEVMYTPLDYWPIMRRAFSAIRPARILLVEAEIWPNLAAMAHVQRVPLALVNARLSPHSERRFRRFGFFVTPTFRLLDLICVQEPEDVDRWAAFGVEHSRIMHTGSIKYDPENVEVDSTLPRKILRELNVESRPILFGGSTHPGEEEILATIFRELHAKFPELFLIVVPRHAERAPEVYSGLEQLGLHVAMRSQLSIAGLSTALGASSTVDCLLLDSTGELRNWYPVATVAFIGKSLTAHGGQNPVEPIMAGVPVIFGPNMENFAGLAISLVARGGAVQVDSASTLQRAIVGLLTDPRARQTLVANANAVLHEHTGAAARTAKLIVDLAAARG
jgi:3-deoxy-D-manno-octulosonic-acid transferase